MPRFALALLTALGAAVSTAGPLADATAPAVRITSPLGRTGGGGAVRIVAQVAGET